jgi:chromosome segregation ATPase
MSVFTSDHDDGHTGVNFCNCVEGRREMSRESVRSERVKRATRRHARRQKAKELLKRAAEADVILATEKARAEQRIADAQIKLSEFGQEVEQKTATVESLTVELASTKEDLVRVIGERVTEHLARERAEHEVASLKCEAVATLSSLAALRKDLVKAERDLAGLRAQDAEVAPLRRRLKERADEIQSLRTQLVQARAQIPPRPLVFGTTKG